MEGSSSVGGTEWEGRRKPWVEEWTVPHDTIELTTNIGILELKQRSRWPLVRRLRTCSVGVPAFLPERRTDNERRTGEGGWGFWWWSVLRHMVADSMWRQRNSTQKQNEPHSFRATFVVRLTVATLKPCFAAALDQRDAHPKTQTHGGNSSFHLDVTLLFTHLFLHLHHFPAS